MKPCTRCGGIERVANGSCRSCIQTKPCRRCGAIDRASDGRCRPCYQSKGARLAAVPCVKCGATDRTKYGLCRPCDRTAGERLARTPCVQCGATDRDRSGLCRPCAADRRAQYRNQVVGQVHPPCLDCGSTARSPNGSCRCLQQARRRANPEINRRNHHRRRARKAAVPSEPFTLHDIFTRDGTDCSLCGDPLDLALVGAGSLDPRWREVPTIDHTIPLSKGGPDVLANATAAHQHCNASKSNRLEAAA